MNTKLLREVKKEILKEPGRFFMEGWTNTDAHYSRCGTAACIGGWALVLKARGGKRLNKRTFPATIEALRVAHYWASSIVTSVREALRISEAQMNRLCGLGYWPDRFLERYQTTRPGSRERAEAAAERIEHFIKTKGAE